jgi:hypothetical protein
MSGSIKFFEYYMRPKDIVMNTMSSQEIAQKKQEKLNQYEHIYREGFCKAYGIECNKDDVKNFLHLIRKNILDRHNPEGVDFRPVGSMVRLWIAPRPSYMQLGVSSYNIERDYPVEFDKFRELLLKHPKKSEGLDSIVNKSLPEK